MSHRIYTTPGFIVGSRPYGEAGRILFIFTEELGQISAIAQGIRLSKSKLRYHARDYSAANFSLVRGKEFWRIVGAESASAGLPKITVTDPAYALCVRMFSVLSRLLQGEEKNMPLFESVAAAHDFLTKKAPEKAVGEPPKNHLEFAEPVIMLRILHHLGYVRSVSDLAPFLKDNSFAPELFESFSVPGMKAKAVREINAALRESHL